MRVNMKNDPTEVFDRHYALKYPHCGIQSNISAVSIPRYEFVARFRPSMVGVAYRCDSCNAPIFLRFPVQLDTGNHQCHLHEPYEVVERPRETYDYAHLPPDVAADFKEALDCYSAGALNGFAAMCRRTVQSASAELGAQGTDKVLNQLRDLKEMAHIDDDTFAALKQAIVDGHDGAHPHLPRLTSERAAVLFELMKDVLYQLFVRRSKIKEAMQLRRAAIENAG